MKPSLRFETAKEFGEMSDQEIKCKDCPVTFTFTAGEQAFFTERNFTTPVRCKPCRDKRKAEKEGRDSNGGGHISGGKIGRAHV